MFQRRKKNQIIKEGGEILNERGNKKTKQIRKQGRVRKEEMIRRKKKNQETRKRKENYMKKKKNNKRAS